MRSRIISSALAVVMAATCLSTPAYAGKKEKPAPPVLPHCARPIGTATVIEPALQPGANAPWWAQMNLGSPVPVLESYLTESGCYTLVASGANSERDRRLEAAGARPAKKATMRADFVIVPNMVNENGNKIGSSGLASAGVGTAAAMFFPPAAALSLLKVKKQSADITLSVTDTRRRNAEDAEFVGSASKRSVSMYYSGLYGQNKTPTSVSDYGKTSQGQLILTASLEAFTKMVIAHGGVIIPSSTATSEPISTPASEQVAVAEPDTGVSYTVDSKVNLRAGPTTTEKIVILLPAGAVLHPTGREAQGWIEVQTDSKQNGWVKKALLIAG